MPSLARGRPSAATPRQSRGPVELPVYEPVLHPLNQNALNELQALPRNHKLTSLNDRLKAANNHLTEAAAEINDRLVAKTARLEKVKRRRENADSQGDVAEEEQELFEMREFTKEMTGKLDQRLRDMLDARIEVSNTERVLQDLEANVVSNRGQIAPTQSTLGASQMRSTNRHRGGGDDDDDDDLASAGLYNTMQQKLRNGRNEYQASSLAERYSAHNDYISFKKIVHDAQHPGDNAPPLPHASTWFASDGKGANSQSFATTLQNESDDDFQVESERTTVRCPITLLRMKEPMQSSKCPHNFEKEAIFEMLRMSEIGSDGIPHRGRGMYQKAVKCPECEIVGDTSCLPNPHMTDLKILAAYC